MTFPYLSCEIRLWGSAYRRHLHKIEVMQKKAIKCLHKAKYNDLRFCTDVIKSRDICCCHHVGGRAIPGYTGLVHWEPGHVHVWCTTDTKYIGINDIMGHTCVAVSYNSRPGRDKTIPVYR